MGNVHMCVCDSRHNKQGEAEQNLSSLGATNKLSELDVVVTEANLDRHDRRSSFATLNKQLHGGQDPLEYNGDDTGCVDHNKTHSSPVFRGMQPLPQEEDSKTHQPSPGVVLPLPPVPLQPSQTREDAGRLLGEAEDEIAAEEEHEGCETKMRPCDTKTQSHVQHFSGDKGPDDEKELTTPCQALGLLSKPNFSFDFKSDSNSRSPTPGLRAAPPREARTAASSKLKSERKSEPGSQRASRNRRSLQTELRKCFIRACDIGIQETVSEGVNEHVYLTEVLGKYRPGFTMLYVPRVCEATENWFQYFAPTKKYVRTPLLRLRFEDIESVSRLTVSVIARSPRPQSADEYKHQFEIAMKPGWTLRKSKQYLNIPLMKERINPILRRMLPPSPDRNEMYTYANLQQPPQIHSASGRFSQAEEGHLMPKPLLLDRYRDSISSARAVQEVVEAPLNVRVQVDGIAFPSSLEARDFVSFQEEHGPRLSAIKDRDAVDVKNPKKWIKSVASPCTWNSWLIHLITSAIVHVFQRRFELIL